MKSKLVINTSPIISIIAATGGLDILEYLYSDVIITKEVYEEIFSSSEKRFAKTGHFNQKFLHILEKPTEINIHLNNVLDIGEASVIQHALNNNIELVCIDEKVGRRYARLYNRKVTGTLGVLLKIKNLDKKLSIRQCIKRMQRHGIYLSEDLIKEIIILSGEREK